MKVINEKTAIPIGLAITLLGGGSGFLTSFYREQQAAAVSLAMVQKDIQYVRADVSEIKAEIRRLRPRGLAQAAGTQGTPRLEPSVEPSPTPYSSAEYRIAPVYRRN